MTTRSQSNVGVILIGILTKMLHHEEKEYRVSPKAFVRNSIYHLTQMSQRERFYFEDTSTLGAVECAIGDVLRIVNSQARLKEAEHRRRRNEAAARHLKEAHAILKKLDRQMKNRRNWLSALAEQGDTEFKGRMTEAIEHLNNALRVGLRD